VVEDALEVDMQSLNVISHMDPPKQSSRDLDGLVSEHLDQSIVPFLASVSDTEKIVRLKSLSHPRFVCGAGGGGTGGAVDFRISECYGNATCRTIPTCFKPSTAIQKA